MTRFVSLPEPALPPADALAAARTDPLADPAASPAAQALPPQGTRLPRTEAMPVPAVWTDPQPYLQQLEALLASCRGQQRLASLLVVEVLPADPDQRAPLMQAIGQRLCQGLRVSDGVARLGRDSFAVLLFDAGQRVSDQVRSRLDAALRQPYRVDDAGTAWPLLRIGRAVHGLDGQHAAELLRAAQLPAAGD